MPDRLEFGEQMLQGGAISDVEYKALLETTTLDDLFNMLTGFTEYGKISSDQARELFERIAPNIAKTDPIQSMQWQNYVTQRQAELTPKELNTQQQNALLRFLQVGDVDSAKAMTDDLIRQGYISEDDARNYFDWAIYSVNLQRGVTQAEDVFQRQQREKAFWNLPVEQRAKQGAFRSEAELEEWQAEQSEIRRLGEKGRIAAQKEQERIAWQAKGREFEPRPAFEEFVKTVTGPPTWIDWFENKYASQLTQFRASPVAKWGEVPFEETQEYKRLVGLRPSMEEEIGESRAPSAQRKYEALYKAWEANIAQAKADYETPMEKRWTSWLEQKEPEERKEYEERYPYGMTGRPWAMSPRIRTVKF